MYMGEISWHAFIKRNSIYDVFDLQRVNTKTTMTNIQNSNTVKPFCNAAVLGWGCHVLELDITLYVA